MESIHESPSDDGFRAAVLESMDETVRTLLSQEVLDALHSNLKAKRSIDPADIPDHLQILSIVLEKFFGPSSRTIEKRIARRLYSKYGLKFQADESYDLLDYVEAARKALKVTGLKPGASQDLQTKPKLNGPLPLKDDFDGLLVESVREAIEELLGKDSAAVAFRFIERDAPFNKLPQHLPSFYVALRNNFGEKYLKVELAIARKLYEKLSLEFEEAPHAELSAYVARALEKLAERERLGFMSLEF